MTQRITIRVTAFVVLFFAIVGIFIARLYRIQVSNVDQVSADSENYSYYTRVSAARGSILDRNGVVLVSNRVSYNLSINNFLIYSAKGTNNLLLQLTDMCDSLGVVYEDHLPLSAEAPFSYTLDDLTSTYQNYFKTYMAERDWDTDMSASNLMKKMRSTYEIPEDWTDAQARKVIGVRYELSLRNLDVLPTYILSYDVSSDNLAAILELNIPGVSVETSTVRQYNTTYAAHILGNLGKMTAEEYEVYKDKDYAMDAYIGKSGFEYAFEDYLHGTDGYRYTTVSPQGDVLEDYYSTEPVAGSNVELTIDIGLQETTEDALAAYIEALRANTDETADGRDAQGGAAVVLDCKTNEVLACASYPTYDLSTYSENFDALLADEYAPLYNRALQAIYPPGSVYKMVTTIASIDLGGISPYREIEDLGIYTKYQDQGFTPKCMIYTNYETTHGIIDMTQAISVSCNYYFYVMGDELYAKGGSTNLYLDTVAKAMGLGEKTGIELSEEQGYRANEETKKTLYGAGQQGFYAADALMAAIGQSDNRFTVMQLATYASTLANSGTRYRTTFLNRVVSADYSNLILQNQTEVANQLDVSASAMNTIIEGMKRCAREGTAKKVFAEYDMDVCCKTGTAEHDSGGSDNASFICFAPADDPQIAIALYVEKGGHGSGLGEIAKNILDAYFAVDHSEEIYTADNVPG